MELRMMKLLIITLFLSNITSIGEAGWQGPIEIINGTWGNGAGQFGLRSGDSGDTFPLLDVITPDGKIVITDSVNKKQRVFSAQGGFIKDVQWIVKSRAGGRTLYDVPEYSFGPVVGFGADETIYTSSGEKYFLVSPTGQILNTYTTRPPELGSATSMSLGAGQYRNTVKYPDITFQVVSAQPVEKYCRDLDRNLYLIESFTATMEAAATDEDEDKSIPSYKMHKYNQCSREMATLELLPLQTRDFPLGVEYGEPIIAANGDVYTWKRSDTAYSILKWTWVDDPNVPSGPDAPTGLTVMPSTSGLYLTWTASPQDPGCVTGYEVSRATSAGGVGTTIATVNAGVVKYNDTSASAGTTYYYKVRAVAGSEYSNYTSEVSGKR